jgi:hypothetical protein
VVVLLVQGLHRGPTLDASVFAVIAEQMHSGGMPYRDVFDHKPPVIYVVEWFAGVVAPFLDAWTRAWGITVVAALGTLLLLARALGRARRLGTVLALFGLGPLLGAHYFTQGGGQTESLAVLPATAAFLLAIDARRPSTGRALASGLLMAIGGATSFQVAPVALGAATALVLAGGGMRALAVYIAGGAAVAAVLTGWILVAGALPAAFDQLVGYNRAYLSGQSFLHPIPILNLAVAVTMVSPVVAAVAARLAELARRRGGGPDDVGAAIAVLGWLGLVVGQGQFIGHYAIVLAGPFAVLAVPVLERFGAGAADRRMRVLAVTVAVLAATFPTIGVLTTEPGATRRPPIDAVAAAVERQTPEGSRLFVWGNEPYVYLLTSREPAGRYIYLFPLTRPNFTTDAMVADVLRDWEREPPAAIIDASIHRAAVSAHPLLGAWVFAGDPIPDRLDPLRTYVRVNYHLESTIDGWPIYLPN